MTETLFAITVVLCFYAARILQDYLRISQAEGFEDGYQVGSQYIEKHGPVQLNLYTKLLVDGHLFYVSSVQISFNRGEPSLSIDAMSAGAFFSTQGQRVTYV